MTLTFLPYVLQRLPTWASVLAATAALVGTLTACGGGDGPGPAPAPSGTNTARAVANTVYTYSGDIAGGSGLSWNWGDGSVDTTGSPVQKVWNKMGSFTRTQSAQVGGQTATSTLSVAVAKPLANGSYNHACALQPGGTVRCWGDNPFGQLGDGTVNVATTSVAVTGLSDAVAVATGEKHSCALRAGGTVLCWGFGTDGELGNADSPNSSTVTVVVSGLTDAVAIAAGATHTCALRAGGSVQCWGSNTAGELGTGLRSAGSNVPVAVSSLNNATVVALAVGNRLSCALKSSGTVSCWGSNDNGQLGIGSLGVDNPNATPLSLSNVVAITAGGFHACALLANGTVSCWGRNADSQLGGNSSPKSSVPVAVAGLSDVVAVSGGGAHTCALLSAGTVRCWGQSAQGQLGNGSTSSAPPIISPVAFGSLTDVVSIAAGGSNTCALQASGSVSCAGLNADGGLGDGTSGPGTDKNIPTPVLGGAIFWK